MINVSGATALPAGQPSGALTTRDSVGSRQELWKAYAVHETREPRDQHSQGLVPRPYSSRTRPVPETASFAPKRQARYRLFDVSWGDGCEKGAGRVASVRLGEQREKLAVSDGQAFIVASE